MVDCGRRAVMNWRTFAHNSIGMPALSLKAAGTSVVDAATGKEIPAYRQQIAGLPGRHGQKQV